MKPPKHIVLPPLPSGIPIGAVLAGVIAVVLVAAVISSVFTVKTEDVGLVLRFGKYSSTAEPGLHFKWPFGIDQVVDVPIRRQLKQEFGFRTQQASIRTQYDARELPDESLMVTGDRNAAVVEWIVQYRIENPTDFMFEVRSPQESLRDATESVMRAVVGDRTVDEVLTFGRQEIEANSQVKLQELVDKYKMGINIEQLVLQDVNPPEPVRASFNEVNEAQQEREKMINDAQKDYNTVVPRARGEADQRISEAEGYATQRVNEAEGDAGRFSAVLAEYIKAPEVTKRRIYLETLAEIIPRLGNKYILDADAQQILPLLQLDSKGKGNP
jgi:membrane protease subunit HflK